MCRDDGKVEASNARDLYDAAAVHKEGCEGMHRRSRSEWISGGNGQMSGWSGASGFLINSGGGCRIESNQYIEKDLVGRLLLGANRSCGI